MICGFRYLLSPFFLFTNLNTRLFFQNKKKRSRYCFKINILPFIWIVYVFIFQLDNYNAPSATAKLSEKLRSVDFTGAALIAFANVALATGLLLGGNTHDWDSFLIILLIMFSVIAFLLFGFHQVCWAMNPIISSTIATNKNVCGASACMLFICIASSATICLVPQFFMVCKAFKN